MNQFTLSFLTVAPLLYFGIWLVAQESLLGSNLLEDLLRGREGAKKIKKYLLANKLEDITFEITFFALLLIVTLFIALRYAKTPFLLLIAISCFYLFMQRRKVESENRAIREAIDGELPGLIQMLTLMISSGISPLRAIELIALRTDSNVSLELGQIIERIRMGDPSSRALDDFARRVNTLDARRFSNAVTMGLERGSPLVPVLSALVGDARNEEKTRLLKRVGKSEIALMIPVVFLLLPISVLFALFPSFAGLEMF